MWSFIALAIVVVFIMAFLSVAVEEPAVGIIIITIGAIFFLCEIDTTFSIIMMIVGAGLFIYAKDSKKKRNEIPPLHFTVSSTGSYRSILNDCETIVQMIAKRFSWEEFHVTVQVQKINSSMCYVYFGIYDVLFKMENVTFGREFKVSDDLATFETKQATGFTTVQDVKRELTLQFCWPDVSTRITELKVIDYGDLTYTPMVILRFDAKYKQ